MYIENQSDWGGVSVDWPNPVPEKAHLWRILNVLVKKNYICALVGVQIE